MTGLGSFVNVGQQLCVLVCKPACFVCVYQAQMLLSESQTAELLSFLTPGARPDVKGQATGFLLGLSGNRYEAEDNGVDCNIDLISIRQDITSNMNLFFLLS